MNLFYASWNPYVGLAQCIFTPTRSLIIVSMLSTFLINGQLVIYLVPYSPRNRKKTYPLILHGTTAFATFIFSCDRWMWGKIRVMVARLSIQILQESRSSQTFEDIFIKNSLLENFAGKWDIFQASLSCKKKNTQKFYKLFMAKLINRKSPS